MPVGQYAGARHQLADPGLGVIAGVAETGVDQQLAAPKSHSI